MSAAGATGEYRPAAFSFAEAETRIAEGNAQIAAAEDEITIQTDALADGKTAAVCALLAWHRAAAARNLRLRFTGTPPRLRKLLQVYQLENTLTEIAAEKENTPGAEK